MLKAIQEQFTNKSVAVIGYGVFGHSAVEFIKNANPERLVILDDNPDLQVPPGIESHTGEGAFDSLEEFDVVVRTPGFPPDRLKSANYVETDTNLLLRYFKRNVLGVTGTKGKSTTVRLIASLLEAAGQEVIVAGNIGRSYFDIFDEISENTVVVAEFSSYQLSDATASPHWSLVLPIASDHLTWHGTQNDYELAKVNLLRYQTQDDALVYWGNGTTERLVNETNPPSRQKKYPEEGSFRLSSDAIVFNDDAVDSTEYQIIKLANLQIQGEHNFYNIIGSLAIVVELLQERDIEVDQYLLRQFSESLKAFKPLEHHLQPVDKVEGVIFVDDSFASTPVATEAALKTITAPKHLIFGGQSRQLDLSSVVKLFDETDVRAVYLLGADKSYRDKLSRLVKSLSSTEVIDLGNVSMEHVVHQAYKAAGPGEAVLLSPAHPSFDMFDNFVDRGEKFQRAVNALIDENSGA